MCIYRILLIYEYILETAARCCVISNQKISYKISPNHQMLEAARQGDHDFKFLFNKEKPYSSDLNVSSKV